MDYNYYNNLNRTMSYAFGLKLEQYMSLDNETKLLLQRAYWDIMNEKRLKKENIKRKALSILKRK